MTRLFYENMISKAFPALQWLRVCTTAPFTATVYACDANLSLQNSESEKIQEFLCENGLASCVHHVKHYFDMKADGVFPSGEVPKGLKEIALVGMVNRKGIQQGLLLGFPMIDPDDIEVDKHTVQFTLKYGVSISAPMATFLELMLSEILPVGCVAKVVEKPVIRVEA